MRQAEKEKKKILFVPNPCKKIPKKNCKKIKKLKKNFSGIFSTQNGLSEAEKERKKFQPQIPFILDAGKKIPKKKMKKKIEKSKNLFPELVLAKTGVDTPEKRKKKNLSRFPFKLSMGKKIPKKIAEN